MHNPNESSADFKLFAIHRKAACFVMLTEFLLLTALTLNEFEGEALRGEINEWVKCFLPKLEKESTRTEKCRLVASVERQEFSDYGLARTWRFFIFVGNKGFIFDENKKQLDEFKARVVNHFFRPWTRKRHAQFFSALFLIFEARNFSRSLFFHPPTFFRK